MRVICAPDSFKESLSANDAAAAMGRGVLAAVATARVDRCPVADGGEGFVQTMLVAARGRSFSQTVTGPLGEPVDAVWALIETGPATTAVIEMAAASGLSLVPENLRNPTRTTTFGTGQLIGAGLDAGAQRIILGIGGSATNDGGCGAAQALGAHFLIHDGSPINEPMTGGLLKQVRRIELDLLEPRLRKTELVVACDVTNSLTGPNGAAHIYGPQKGATPAQIEALDQGLTHLGSLLRDQLNIDVLDLPGSGAAGGLGGGAVGMLGGKLHRGVELVLDTVDFGGRVRGCDLCLTGEGRIDGQTSSGKAVAGVTRLAGACGVPTIALVGSIGQGADRALETGLLSYHAIGEGLSMAESMARAGELLESTTRRVVREFVESG